MPWIAAATTTAGWLTAWGTVAAALGGFIAAIGTVSAVVIALSQIHAERIARQHTDKRAQAERISGWTLTPSGGVGWPSAEGQSIALMNASLEPVYRVVAYLVVVHGPGPRTGREAQKASPDWGVWGQQPDDQSLPNRPSRVLLSVLPPGQVTIEVQGRPTRRAMHYGVELAFTDGVGRHWLRASNGHLSDIAQDAQEYYELGTPPLPWGDPGSSA